MVQGKIGIRNDKGFRMGLICTNYDNPLTLHGGTAKTTQLFSQQNYGPGMRETIKLYITNGDIGQRAKWSKMHYMECCSQTKFQTDFGS